MPRTTDQALRCPKELPAWDALQPATRKPSAPKPAARRPAARKPAARQGGFTLIELMVVVAVLAVLTALAAPSFVTQLANQRVSSAAQELQTLMQFARAQSVYTRTSISVTASGQVWSVKAGASLLRQAQLPANVAQTPGADSGAGVRFDASGAAQLISGSATQYTLALSSPQATRMHCISVTRAGLVRQQRLAANASCQG